MNRENAKKKNKLKAAQADCRGFTLSELMIAAGVLAFAFTGILSALGSCTVSGKFDRNTNFAWNAARAEIEELKNVAFSDLDTGYNNTTFDVLGITASEAKGRVEVSDYAGSSDCKLVRVIVSYKSGQRTIGEDVDFDGAGVDVDPAEDANLNGRLDSPVELATLISNE